MNEQVFENRLFTFPFIRKCLKTGWLSNFTRGCFKKDARRRTVSDHRRLFRMLFQHNGKEGNYRQRDLARKRFGMRENTLVRG